MRRTANLFSTLFLIMNLATACSTQKNSYNPLRAIRFAHRGACDDGKTNNHDYNPLDSRFHGFVRQQAKCHGSQLLFLY